MIFPGTLHLRHWPAAATTAWIIMSLPFGTRAQDTATTENLRAQQQAARSLEQSLPKPELARSTAFALDVARQQRLEKLLPRAFRKLAQREAFEVLALGDPSILLQSGADTPALGGASFPFVFAKELARAFYYTGGVRLVGEGTPPRKEGEGILGPEITVRIIAREGGSALDAPQIMATWARQTHPDLLLLCYGQTDAWTGTPEPSFSRSVERAIDSAHEIGADAIVCGPMPAMRLPAERALGLPRALGDAARRAAAEAGVPFIELSVLPPTEAADQEDPAQLFEQWHARYRSLFHEDAAGSFTAGAALHARLGSQIFQSLIEAPAPAPWSALAASATWESTDKLSLRYKLKNNSPARLDLTVLPLPCSGWKPVEASPSLTLAAGTEQDLQIRYSAHDPQSVQPAMPEGAVVLPLLVLAPGQVRVHDLRVHVAPVVVEWGLETFFNLEGSFSPSCHITNNTGKTQSITWQARFMDQSTSGNVGLKASASEPLDLSFKLPKPPDQRLDEALELKVMVDGQTLIFHRRVEITPNFGLKQPQSLLPAQPAAASTAKASLRCDADPGKLFLICDLEGIDIQDTGGRAPAWRLQINLDARGYGQRLTRGSTASLVITGSAADGPATVHPVMPWAFGDGYAAVFDPQQFSATMASTASGARRITFSMPRTYLYLHDWALGNGNSQLGLNLRLTVLQADPAAPTFQTWSLVRSGKHPDDAEALTVLELTADPTLRCTVNVY